MLRGNVLCLAVVAGDPNPVYYLPLSGKRKANCTAGFSDGGVTVRRKR